MSSKGEKVGEKKEEEDEVKAVPRRRRVIPKEGEEERAVTPTPGPEGEEDEEDTPTKEEGDQETVSEELTTMGQKVEEIKGDGEASEGEVVVQEDKKVVPAAGEVQAIEESAPSTGPSVLNERILKVLIAMILPLIIAFLCHYIFSAIYSAGPVTMFEGEENADILEMAEKLQTENKLMLEEMANLQEINLDPIKIKGKEGAKSRQLREGIHQLIAENEELRLAVGRLWLTEQQQTSPAHKAAFSDALTENHRLRSETEKLKHLGSDLQDLESSVASLKEENNNLRIAFADFKYQKVPIPKELDVVSRETESIAKQVIDASRKRKPPPNLPNARNYVAYMGQILSTMSSLHEFGEASAFGKIDIASDVFTDLVPKPNSVPPTVEQKLRQGRAKFQELKASLATKWGQLKSLSEPENIRAVGRDTLTKMNRVLVNVVSKLKEIGQTDLLRRGKTPVEKTASALADKLTVLDEHFDHTWNDLEAEVNMEAVDEELAQEMIEDDGSEVVDASDDGEDLEEGDEVAQPTPPAAKMTPTAARAENPKEKKDVPKKKEDVKKVKEERVKGKVSTSTKRDPSDEKKKPVKKVDRKKEEKKVEKSTKISEKKSESNNSKPALTAKKEDAKRGKKLPKKADRESKKDENNNDVDDEDRKSSGSKSGTKSRESGAADDGKEGARYFKGHYNKDKTGEQKKTGKRDATEKKKHLKRSDSDDDDDDDDDDSSKGGAGKKSGLNRHWEKPVKKNFFRDALGSRRQFIRRKGKEEGKRENFTRRDGKWRAQRDDDDDGSVKNVPSRAKGKVSMKIKSKSSNDSSSAAIGRAKNGRSVGTRETMTSVKISKVSQKKPSKDSKTWDEKRSQGRSKKRLGAEKAEWQFERARDRRDKRESATQAEWQFDRDVIRRNLRDAKKLLKQKRSERKRLEREQRKRREEWRMFKRSVHDDDEDDFDDDDYDYYGRDSRFVKRKTYQNSGRKGKLSTSRDR